MRLITLTLALMGLVLAEPNDQACPTVTKETLPSSCARRCNNPDCVFVSTVNNPCNCPDAVPTATLIHPCGADCPNNGCAVEIHTNDIPCPVETSTPTRRPTSRPTPPSSSPSSPANTGPPVVVTSITALPPRTTPCPTVTHTTMPGDCPRLRCPVPNCAFEEVIRLPCGCQEPRTVLFVTGCPTDCPDGCLTRTRTRTAEDCRTR